MAVVTVAMVCFASWNARSDEPDKSPVTKQTKPHPLDPALKRAREGVAYIKKNVADYTATIVKHERVGDELQDPQVMFAKVRNSKVKDGEVVVPFSVYLKFLKPDSIKGREVIWVEGANDGKLIAHEAGLLGIKRFNLAPDGFIAMLGQRYPIHMIGIQNLVEELIVKGEKDLKHDECEVKFYKNAKVGKRVCTLIEVLHPVERDYFEFYRARIFIDDKLKVPVRYAAWSWPLEPGGQPQLIEEYTYLNLKLNVGLTDKDFDPDNGNYKFP